MSDFAKHTPETEPVPGDFPSVAVMILNWNGHQLLAACLTPLLQQDYPDYRVVLIDNGSDDDSIPFVRDHFPRVEIVEHGENLGFSRGYNPALRQTTADVVILLNNDVIVSSGWLRALIKPLRADKQIGAAGCKLLFPDGTIQHLGASLSYPQAYSQHAYYQEPDTNQVSSVQSTPYVTGAAMAIPRFILEEVGLLDEGFSPFYYEEADFCYRVRAAGYRVVVVPAAVAVHDESTSMRAIPTDRLYAYERNRLRFVLKHYTPAQVIQDFVPAEDCRLREPAPASLYQARRQAFLQSAVSAPIIMQQPHPDELHAIQEALLRLHRMAATRTPAQFHPQPDSHPYASLSAAQELTEFSARSPLPVVGSLITRVRQLWYGMAAKWAVRHLQQEQMRFNRLVTQILDEQAARSEADAREIGLLAAELARLQRQQITQKEGNDGE